MALTHTHIAITHVKLQMALSVMTCTLVAVQVSAVGLAPNFSWKLSSVMAWCVFSGIVFLSSAGHHANLFHIILLSQLQFPWDIPSQPDLRNLGKRVSCLLPSEYFSRSDSAGLFVSSTLWPSCPICAFAHFFSRCPIATTSRPDIPCSTVYIGGSVTPFAGGQSLRVAFFMLLVRPLVTTASLIPAFM